MIKQFYYRYIYNIIIIVLCSMKNVIIIKMLSGKSLLISIVKITVRLICWCLSELKKFKQRPDWKPNLSELNTKLSYQNYDFVVLKKVSPIIFKVYHKGKEIYFV